MSQVVRSGGDPVMEIRQRANAAVRRRWFYLAVVAAALLVALLAVPEKQTTSPSALAGSNASLLPGMTPPTAQYASGATVGGVACGPGVRQGPWSSYAPPCQPAWHGNNGGATSRGVSKTTITLSYREIAGSQLALVYSLLPQSVGGGNTSNLKQMTAYINTFNHSFELYGRHVVLAPYTGKGQFIDESL